MIELSTWIEYVGIVDQLKVDLCNKSETICTKVKTIRSVGEELFSERLATAIAADPKLANESELRLRWGYFEEKNGNIVPLITARVGLDPVEVRQGRLNQIDFLDGTAITTASCRYSYQAKAMASPRLVGVDGVGFITRFGCSKNE